MHNVVDKVANALEQNLVGGPVQNVEHVMHNAVPSMVHKVLQSMAHNVVHNVMYNNVESITFQLAKENICL